jgi:hypothetical protein
MLRRSLLVIAVVAALFALAGPSGAQDSFAGSWSGPVAVNGMSCRIDLVMTAGTYNQLARCGTYVTGQSGAYRVFPNRTISLTVTNWTPKSRYIVGAQAGTGHYEANAKPPGGTYRYVFTNANTMVWRDANFGGTITYRRVR